MKHLRPTSKLTVILLALIGAAVLLTSGGRIWATGTVNDPVLGASRISGTGTELATGVVALALVAAAAALASATSGPLVRRVTLVVLALTGLGVGFVATRVGLDPEQALGAVAARSLGRTGSIETHATATAWPWIAVVASALVLLAAVAGWFGASSWRGLGARYEAPGATAGARGQRVASDWDRLDAGDDPTARDDPTVRDESSGT
ncbi:Trp biosynthesis-associated membrane protein [Pedococcus sp. KACC 23699]|uniref:Trp biosynthesis-associated membrane protein n=1 Tax=Pedococcus sp. KACC 23699 TaxID=3149228 RepID=A0AAU7JUT5_9MICO